MIQRVLQKSMVCDCRYHLIILYSYFILIMNMKKTHLQKMKQAVVQFIEDYNPESPLDQQLDGHILSERMKLLEVHEMSLPPFKLGTKIAERTLQTALDDDGLRISLYYMPKGTRMPLHDHPQMMVLTFILEGQVSATLYSPTIHHSIFFKEEITLKSQSFALIDGIRTNERNLHQLYAVQNTLFMDIIFPDYDENERDCSCYEVELELEPNLCKLRKIPCDFDMEEL